MKERKGMVRLIKQKSRILAAFLALALVFSNIAANVQTVYAVSFGTDEETAGVILTESTDIPDQTKEETGAAEDLVDDEKEKTVPDGEKEESKDGEEAGTEETGSDEIVPESETESGTDAEDKTIPDSGDFGGKELPDDDKNPDNDKKPGESGVPGGDEKPEDGGVLDDGGKPEDGDVLNDDERPEDDGAPGDAGQIEDDEIPDNEVPDNGGIPDDDGSSVNDGYTETPEIPSEDVSQIESEVTVYSDAPYNDVINLETEVDQVIEFGAEKTEQFGLPEGGVWKSSDETVLIIDPETGKVTIMTEEGECQITYTYTEAAEDGSEKVKVALWDVVVGVGVKLMNAEEMVERNGNSFSYLPEPGESNRKLEFNDNMAHDNYTFITPTNYNHWYWAPYEEGSSHYRPGIYNLKNTASGEVIHMYCSDYNTSAKENTAYMRENIENSYYGHKQNVSKLYGILENSFPYIGYVEMLERMAADDVEFATTVDLGQIIAAVQFSIWDLVNDTEVTYGGTRSWASYYNNVVQGKGCQNPFGKNDYVRKENEGNYEYTYNDEKIADNIQAIKAWLKSRESTNIGGRTEIIKNISADVVHYNSDGDSYDVLVRVKLNAVTNSNDRLNVEYTVGNGNVTNTISVPSNTDSVSFPVQVKKDEEITAKLTGTQYVEKAGYYYHTDPEQGKEAGQAFVGIDEGEATVNSVAKIKLSEASATIKVHKIDDADTPTPLAGAVFRLYLDDEPEDVYVGEGETDEDGNLTFKNLNPQFKYYIKESRIPDGYVVSPSWEGNIEIPSFDKDNSVEVTVVNNKIKPAYWTPSVVKNFDFENGTDPSKNERDFTFTLSLDSKQSDPAEGVNWNESGNHNATVNFDNGWQAAFNPVKFTKAGKYYFTIKENDPGISGYTKGNNNVWPMQEITIEVALVGDQLRITRINNTEIDAAESINVTRSYTFTNKYKVTETQWAPGITKKVEGDVPVDAFHTFTFELSAGKDQNEQGYALPENCQTSITIKGKNKTADGKFEDITFKQAGTYQFQIEEVKDSPIPGYEYDSSVYDLSVTIGDIDSQLKVTHVTIKKEGSTSFDGDVDGDVVIDDSASLSALFVNNYKTNAAHYAPVVRKTIAGNPARDETFTFYMEAAKDYGDAVKMPGDTSVTVVGEGTGAFDNIIFNKAGEYEFTIVEEAGTNPGYTYDESRWTLKVSVVDELDPSDSTKRALWVVSSIYTKDDAEDSPGDAAQFENSYKTPHEDKTPHTPVHDTPGDNTPRYDIPDGDTPRDSASNQAPDIEIISDEPAPRGDFDQLENIEDDDVPLAFLAPMTGDDKPIGAAALFGLIALGMMGMFGILARKKDENDA